MDNPHLRTLMHHHRGSHTPLVFFCLAVRRSLTCFFETSWSLTTSFQTTLLGESACHRCPSSGTTIQCSRESRSAVLGTRALGLLGRWPNTLSTCRSCRSTDDSSALGPSPLQQTALFTSAALLHNLGNASMHSTFFGHRRSTSRIHFVRCAPHVSKHQGT